MQGLGDYASAEKASVESMRSQWEINAVGPLLVFQAFKPLQSHDGAKFAVISTIGASFGVVFPIQFPMTGYASSKAAANMILKMIHFENPKLAVAAIHPGMGEHSRTSLMSAPR